MTFRKANHGSAHALYSGAASDKICAGRIGISNTNRRCGTAHIVRNKSPGCGVAGLSSTQPQNDCGRGNQPHRGPLTLFRAAADHYHLADGDARRVHRAGLDRNQHGQDEGSQQRARDQDVFHVVGFVGVGVASWSNHLACGTARRQICGLQKSAVKNFQAAGGENSFTSSPSTPIPRTRSARSGALPNRSTPTAPFTTGSLDARKRRRRSFSRSSAISSRIEGMRA